MSAFRNCLCVRCSIYGNVPSGDYEENICCSSDCLCIITVLIVISKDGITVVLGLADPVTPSKSNRSVNRTPMEKSHKRLTADNVPGYDRVDDADDDASADNDSNSNEFRRPIGVMPTPWAGKGSFSDYYGHEYTNIGGTIYDDNGNFCPDYMRSYYGIPDDEDSQNDGW